MTDLRSIVYSSSATHELTTAQLETLLADAHAFNHQHAVTGVLLYSGWSFMQCFEGASKDVDKAYARIKRSSHHTDLVEYLDCAIPTRTFESWGMGLTKSTNSQILTLASAKWSTLTQRRHLPESQHGLSMLKVFWSMRQEMERILLMATRDELTGLPNRRHAQDLLEREVRRRHDERGPLSVCMIDIDHFKRVNDTLGHAAGDQVLRFLAQRSQAVLRETDVLTRWGGEEFLLLLPNTPLAEASRLVERLLIHLSSQGVSGERPELRVTFSGGIAAHLEGETVQETISRADTQLYQAKAQGRNRVLMSA